MVSIITINYNTTYLTVQLLRSIEKVYQQSMEVIVVDNGSTINPVHELTSAFPWITFIRSDENLGFAGGNNLGVEAATGDYVFFINNDTEFLTDIITHMVEVLKSNPTIGILCPVIRYFDNHQIQYAGFTSMNSVTGRNECITKLKESEKGKVLITQFAHGAAMMVPKYVIDKTGLMSDNYFLYFEEMDWSKRIQSYGYQIAVDTQSDIYHKESQTVGEGELKSYLMTRNRILYMRKFSAPLKLAMFWIFFLFVAAPKHMFVLLVQRKLTMARAFIEGILWNFQFSVFSKTIGYKFNHLRHDQ